MPNIEADIAVTGRPIGGARPKPADKSGTIPFPEAKAGTPAKGARDGAFAPGGSA